MDYGMGSPFKLLTEVVDSIIAMFSNPSVAFQVTILLLIGQIVQRTIATGTLNLQVETLPAQLMQAFGLALALAAIAPAENRIMSLASS